MANIKTILHKNNFYIKMENLDDYFNDLNESLIILWSGLFF